MKAETDYSGLTLIAENESDLKDLQIIIDTLNKHNIKIGGYDFPAYSPEISENELYLGR